MRSREAQSAANRGIVELRIRKRSELFDPLDPSPFREQDLLRNAEAFIVDSVKEHPSGEASAIVIYLSESTGSPEEERVVGDAIHAHFARVAKLLRRDLRRLLRRGLISLGIGLAFLAALFVAAQLVPHFVGEGAFAALARESLLIAGWVAMWRPLEIFLYDWWPILAEQRLHERLSRINVRVVRSGEDPSPGGVNTWRQDS